MSGVASIAQSSTINPPQSLVLPSLGLSPSTPGSSVTVTYVLVQPTICVASSSVSTAPMIPGGLTFEEYLLVVQQQNSQGSQQSQAPANPHFHNYDFVGNPIYIYPYHYNVYGNPVYFPPIDPL